MAPSMAGMERAGVADAGGAAVADGLEAELVEFLLQAGGFEVVGDDAGAGPERGLDEGRDGEALCVGLLGDQAGGEHDARVGGVGAARDGGDERRAVAELGVDVERGDASSPSMSGLSNSPAGRVEVQRHGRCRAGRRLRPKPPSPAEAVKSALNLSPRAGTSMRSCGRFGPATPGTMVARSSSRRSV